MFKHLARSFGSNPSMKPLPIGLLCLEKSSVSVSIPKQYPTQCRLRPFYKENNSKRLLRNHGKDPPMTTLRFPYADTRFSKFLRKRILEVRPKTQRQIAVEAGFVSQNMIAMLKSGATKMPLDRVSALARALDCDPRYLFLLTLEQAGNETTQTAIEEIFGTIVSKNEAVWLNEIREASGHTDPTLTARARSAIRGIFGK